MPRNTTIPHDGQNLELLHRVEKAIIITAALLAIAAIVVHHPGLIAVVAFIALLAYAQVERIGAHPAADSSQAVSNGYRPVDGGCERYSQQQPSTHPKQPVIVLDGGCQRPDTKHQP